YLTTADKGTFGNRRIIMDIFPCGDGEYLMIHTGRSGAFKASMDILGLGEKVQTITDRVEMTVPLDDEEYRLAREGVPEAFKRKPRDEWVRMLQDADVAVIPMQRPGEVLDDPQVAFAGLDLHVPDPDHGTIRQIGQCIVFEKSVPPKPEPAPAVGAHNAELP